MDYDRLLDYVKKATARGQSREATTMVLLKSGWKIFDVEAAFIEVFGKAAANQLLVPKPTDSLTAVRSSSMPGASFSTFKNFIRGHFLSSAIIAVATVIFFVFMAYLQTTTATANANTLQTVTAKRSLVPAAKK